MKETGSPPGVAAGANEQASAKAEMLRLNGKRVAVVLFSHYPSDPRPRRAAEAMAQAGMEVDVISLNRDEDPRREVLHGVNILRLPLKHRRGGKFAYIFQYASFISFSFLVLAFRSLRRRYHLVHVHNMPDILVFSALVPKICGAKVILDLHDPMPELMMTIFGLEQDSFGVRLLKHLEKWSTRFANIVVTVSQTFKKLFADRSCPAEKLRVVMNSPDEEIFEYQPVGSQALKERDPTKPFVIMYHGSLVERHGLDLAVQAFGEIKKSIPAAELRIYGRRTPFIDRVMGMVSCYGLEGGVRYLGEKDLEGIVEAIDACDVGIIPNRRSVFTEINTPTRVFEYLARGKPVIGPLAAGVTDYFKSSALVFFELGNADDLARKIEYVFSHPREVQEVIEQGQEVYRAHRWSKERAGLVALVSELLNGSCHLPGQPVHPILPVRP